LGVDLPDARMVAIFEALGLTVCSQDALRCEVEIPAFRVDLDQEADLIEELSRIHGLDKVPSPAPDSIIIPGADDSATRALLVCRGHLVGLGLSEIMNYSFLSEKLLNLVGFGKPENRILLPNPISADHTVLRDSFIPQMLETLGRNRARQAREAALFELGRVFFKRADGRNGEEDRVCVGLLGPVGRSGIQKTQPVTDEDMYAWIKGILEEFCRALHVESVGRGGMSRMNLATAPCDHACFEPGHAVTVSVAGEACGVMGLISERLRNEWRLVEPVAVMELSLALLLKQVWRVPVSSSVGSYPGVERDVAMVVEAGVSHEGVLNVVSGVAPQELVELRLFDVYRGENLGKGRKSLAYSMTYRSLERTLTDEEANAFHDRVKAALRQELSAEIREGA
jgi:phenylalanyl-tRNA synthetase beta chain